MMQQDDALREQADPTPTPAAAEGGTPEAPAPEDSAPEPVNELTEAETPESPQPQAGSGADVSTAPPTASAPPPGVPAEPVNAVAEDGSIPGPRMDPERIGEAQKPPAGDSAPAQS